MKMTILLFVFVLPLVSCGKKNDGQNTKSEVRKNAVEDRSRQVGLMTGDIIFQSSHSHQALAIQLATQSLFSHCGMVIIRAHDTLVLEAVQPVKLTPFMTFVSHGHDHQYALKRAKNLSPMSASQAEKYAQAYLGKNYDLVFEWGDDRLYCSELVYKVFEQHTGQKLCKLRPLKDYHLDSKLVREKLRERYGDKLPMDRLMVSPQDIYDSELLEEVQN